ncbi:MAG: hypothetical protein KGI54_04030 [Pseudomonadota bacterium]|nr:hypothetical protein [Pseudomonadota bacterium]
MQQHDHDDDLDNDDDIDENELGEIPVQLGDNMQSDDEPEYTITIEYDNFLTRFDLDEILSSIDRIIEDELFSRFNPEFHLFFPKYYKFPYWYRDTPEFSYVGITGVDHGSIILTVLASAAVVHYVATRFKKGVDKSLLAEELERSGQLSGDLFGPILSRINDWAEKYVPKQQELGGKVKKVRVERKRKNKPPQI